MGSGLLAKKKTIFFRNNFSDTGPDGQLKRADSSHILLEMKPNTSYGCKVFLFKER